MSCPKIYNNRVKNVIWFMTLCLWHDICVVVAYRIIILRKHGATRETLPSLPPIPSRWPRAAPSPHFFEFIYRLLKECFCIIYGECVLLFFLICFSRSRCPSFASEKIGHLNLHTSSSLYFVEYTSTKLFVRRRGEEYHIIMYSLQLHE